MFAPKMDGLGFVARRIAIAEIDRAVAGRLGPTRAAGNAQPAAFNRQVAMYLAKRVGGWSLTKIGKFYNGRPHTTVCYAIRRIAALRAVHAEVDGLLKSLAEEIKSRPTTDSQQRIHVVGLPMSSAWPWPASEEFVEDLVERMISRLRPTIVEALAARIPQRCVRGGGRWGHYGGTSGDHTANARWR